MTTDVVLVNIGLTIFVVVIVVLVIREILYVLGPPRDEEEGDD